MAQFKFQLAGVLRHREHQEQECQRVLAIAQAELRKAEDALRAINTDIETNGIALRDNHLVGRLDMAFLAGQRRYIAALHRQAQTLVQELNLHHQRAGKARDELNEAAKARKILEKLYERQLSRWTEEKTRKEVAVLDEVSMQMALSNLAEEEAFLRRSMATRDDEGSEDSE